MGPPLAAPEVSVETLALRTLPIRQRQAIVLHHLVGLPVEEVAQTLRMPAGTPAATASDRRGGLAGLSGAPGGGARHRRAGQPPDPLTPAPTATTTPTATSVTRVPAAVKAVRLRIVFRNGPPIDLVPLDAGPQFPVKFYAVFYLQPATRAWMPERVIGYDKAGRPIAECWATTGEGNVCDRPQGAPQPP